ncbi:bifunctional riboflavin kinase/FAD synthetase [Phormidium sp. CCY1219]|uniref:bifunctional riboflavin kinase/FAD synthetase n=1 Tax=Phormidium sp. CCY1219 TaxID=2886104 RepID=UPI002D1F9620|nr:bifunctional riboflavin kinase/FAD synthetase [Phormidium sp. CCY1219]MEB3831228.1 bifunctional riboflavin kinase/FAD synthetase [Phormidium sp. CCY1219]
MWITSTLSTALTPTSVALGNFDGVHRGHRQVMQPIFNPLIARQPIAVPPVRGDSSIPLRASHSKPPSPDRRDRSMAHPYATVVTFSPHPKEFFSGQRRSLLTPLDEKVKVLEAMGVEQLVLLPFDRQLARMSPQEFVEQILVRQLKATQISVGEDFCFGRQRSGSVADLQAIAAQYNVQVQIVPLQTTNGQRISSSAIREALQAGKVQRANQILGRPYSLVGKVVRGQQVGRTIGFPTANLQLPPHKFLPRHGVYAVRVHCPGEISPDACAIGALNIGCRPTVDENQTPTVEVHLLDWSGELYDRTLTVELEHFLRSQQKFPSLEALKAQIQTDCHQVRALLAPPQKSSA